MKFLKTVLALFVYFLIITSCSAQKANKQKLPYKDSSLSVEARVYDLLGRMTLEEKISQMNMLSLSKLTLGKMVRLVRNH